MLTTTRLIISPPDKVLQKQTSQIENIIKPFAKPFVKWVGGKRALLNELIHRVPKYFDTYYEPFIGGGALFFALSPKKAIISDTNIDLILAYQAVKETPAKLLKQLKKHKSKHSKEYYYKIRSLHETQDPIERAARLIYLNKTCFNGLYRVNNQGEFNVPIGSYTNPLIADETGILACHEYMNEMDLSILSKPFHKHTPKKGDFVYFDPPYHPLRTSSFTKYSVNDFNEDDQRQLSHYCKDLHKQGIRFVLSNSNTDFIRDLYQANKIVIDNVEAPRNINCKPSGRIHEKEVLIYN